MEKTAIVVGAGIAGIATAIRLRLKGYRVRVFEASGSPGGKMKELQLGGCRFDTGPSLFTMPRVVDQIFREAGKDPRDYFSYRKLDSACRYFYPDGTVMDAYTSMDRFAAEAESVLGMDRKRFARYMEHCDRLYRHTGPLFLENSLHRLKTYLRWSTFVAVLNMPRFDMHTTMHRANRRRLGHPAMVQLFDRMATYNGSDPYQASGVMNVIASLEHSDGAYFADGGMISIARGLLKLAGELGIEFLLNTRVDHILCDKKGVKGVKTGREEHPADLVVSNMDIIPTYEKLLPCIRTPRYLLRQERSSSAVIFYWAMNRRFPALEAHNIFFSSHYREEFEYLFKKQSLYHDPTVYVYISCRQHPPDAPEGMENWFIMINAPHNQGQDWNSFILGARDHILHKLGKRLGTDPAPHIVAEEILDPRLIEERTSSYQGALYGNSSNNWLSAFFRHPNFSPWIRGLYFCGGSVHPGGGVPVCILSSKIVADQIKPIP